MATPDQAQAAHVAIRNSLSAFYGSEDVASGVRIQYGGSVTPESIGQLMGEMDVDGALVGEPASMQIHLQGYSMELRGQVPNCQKVKCMPGTDMDCRYWLWKSVQSRWWCMWTQKLTFCESCYHYICKRSKLWWFVES